MCIFAVRRVVLRILNVPGTRASCAIGFVRHFEICAAQFVLSVAKWLHNCCNVEFSHVAFYLPQIKRKRLAPQTCCSFSGECNFRRHAPGVIHRQRRQHHLTSSQRGQMDCIGALQFFAAPAGCFRLVSRPRYRCPARCAARRPHRSSDGNVS